MNPPAFASIAPAPTIAIAGEEATALIRAIIPADFSGSVGRRTNRATTTSRSAPAITSTTATQVFGADADVAATAPVAYAGATPMANDELRAPRWNQSPRRSGRSPNTSGITENESGVGESMAASEVSRSADSPQLIRQPAE